MRFTFHVRETKVKQRKLADTVRMGASNIGDIVDIVEGFEGPLPGYDGTVIMGVSGGSQPHGSRTIFDAYLEAGQHVVLIDKGYTRKGVADSFRVSINDFHPTRYLMRREPKPDRMESWFNLGNGNRIVPKDYRDDRAGPCILFDGASHKYCAWHRLGAPHEWAEKVVKQLRAVTNRPIIYRPRPDHNTYFPVEGAELSLNRTLKEDFDRSFVVVSHGGNIGFDAGMVGKPHLCLWDSIAKPISETDLLRIEKPYVPTPAERHYWLCNVFYCQWSFEELKNGAAWRNIRNHLVNFNRGAYA